MRNRNKLYTANKWNRPLFANNIDRVHKNVFDGMFGSTLNTVGSQGFWGNAGLGWNQIKQQRQADLLSSTFGQGIYNPPPNYAPLAPGENTPVLSGNMGPQVFPSSLPDLGSSLNQGAMNTAVQDGEKGMEGIAGNSKGLSLLNKKATIDALTNVGLEATGMIGQSEDFKRGLWDRADPLHYLAEGRESKVGNFMGDAGVGIFKQGVQSGNTGMMIAGAALKGVGSLTNAAFGIKTDTERLNAINSGVKTLNAFNSDASSFDDVKGPDAIVDNANGVYKGGWFSSNRAKRKNRKLRDQIVSAKDWTNRSIDNNIENITDTQMDNLLANYAAFGGPLGGIPGATDYGFLSNQLLTRSRRLNKNRGTFALGGDLQTNGGDYTNGLTQINAGGSHENNPHDGVQMGVSQENGNPNLVEEGETIFDDYVFSKRILADAETKKKFHIGKNKEMSFADLSKKLERESTERPNDAISQAGLKKQMHLLAEEQERQKQEQIKEEFEKLPPEQQQAIMQQLAMEQQEAMQQQAEENNAQQQGMVQPELQADKGMQQMENTNEEPQEQQEMQPELQQEQLNAYGGKMNRFDDGGDMRGDVYSLLDNVYTDSDFAEWAKKNGVNPSKIDWNKAFEDNALRAAIAKYNPAISHAIDKGYDFGRYKRPMTDKLTFDFKHGGWGAEDYNAWNGSTDAIWKEAVRKGLVEEGMGSEEIGKALMQTDAYKRGTDWLKLNDNNRLLYLQSILNSEDAPQAAKDYAAKYVDKNGWLKDVAKDYQTIFEDPNGTGVRNTHPGTYWKTPDEILRNKIAKNFVINADGTIEEIYNNVPKDWATAGNYSWQDENDDYTYNYYKRPVSAPKTPTKDEMKKMKPKHLPTWGREAALMGPELALGLQASGLGKYNFGDINTAVNTANQSPALAHANFIGNNLGLTLVDPNREYNKLIANSRAADRAVLNNATPVGTKNAAITSNLYNTINGIGEADIKGIDYNNTQKLKEAEFYKDRDKYNASAATDISKANAEMINRNRQFASQMQMEAAKQKMDAKASWYQGIYRNLNNVFKGLGDYGKENEQHNIIADMAYDGIFGTLGDSQAIAQDYLKSEKPNRRKKKIISAKGGRINRKRGLTF